MSEDLIRRSDAIKEMEQRYQDILRIFKRKVKDGERAIALDMIGCIKSLPSADRPSAVDLSSVYSTAYKSGYEKGKADGSMIYGNEHNCIMTIFGECSYAETGCGDCAVVEKVRKALSADRPQGEWKNYKDEHYCTNCGEVVIGDWYDEDDWYDFCPNCGAQMKGANDGSL